MSDPTPSELNTTANNTNHSTEDQQPKPKKQKVGGSGGFKWKEKPSRTDNDDDRRNDAKLERGYRDRSPPRRREYSDRDRDRDRSPARRREDGGNYRDRSPRRERRHRDDDEKSSDRTRGDSYRPAAPREAPSSKAAPDIASKFGPSAKISTPNSAAKPTGTTTTSSSTTAKSKTPKPAAPAAPTGPMILVSVNDRLGTRAEIPCFASDSIKAFKAMVAMKIGRAPHEILLKRQGERPFKDQLSLEDYGVSSGVQLDLEVDTGD